MIEVLWSLAASAGIYGLAHLVNALIPFASLPIVTRTISPAEYGLYSVFIVLLNLMVPVTRLSRGNGDLLNGPYWLVFSMLTE